MSRLGLKVVSGQGSDWKKKIHLALLLPEVILDGLDRLPAKQSSGNATQEQPGHRICPREREK